MQRFSANYLGLYLKKLNRISLSHLIGPTHTMQWSKHNSFILNTYSSIRFCITDVKKVASSACTDYMTGRMPSAASLLL